MAHEYAVHVLSVLRAWIGTWVGAWASLAHALMAFVPVLAAPVRIRRMARDGTWLSVHASPLHHGVSGTLSLDEQDVTNSKVEVNIPAATINTREPDRDTHLKSADFFDVEKFLTLSFKSTSVIRKPDDELEVEGDLTIHGVTRKVRLAVEGPTAAGKDLWGNTRIGASAITKINRKDYGLVWNAALETGGLLVGDDVAITIDAEFIKA
jgi:polyisoprenoid-binding protein YceI